MEDAVEQQGIDLESGESQQEEAGACTGQRIFGRREEIEDGGGIQPESPEIIQPQVDDEEAGHQKGNEAEIALPDVADDGRLGPDRGNQQQTGNGGEITRQRAVERQSVPHHAEVVSPGGILIEVMVIGHEDWFL